MSLMSAGAQPNVYTVPEAARLLRVRESWLEREAAARRIPFTMLAGSYRFTSDHLIQIVRMHEIKPAAEAAPPVPADVRKRRTAQGKGPLPGGVTQLRPRPRPGPRGHHLT
jgi:excisionase family DNA binding protein